MTRVMLILACICGLVLLLSERALAWGYQGHEVVGAIADELIKDNANASKHVHDTLNSPLPSADEIKRQQLAKAGARLAEILNTIWPKN